MRRLRLLALVLFAWALLVAGSGVWVARALSPVGGDDREIELVVERGATLKRVAGQLEAAGAIRHARAFELLARLRGVGGDLRAGEYAFTPSLGAGEVLDRIVQGEVRTHRVSIPEGLTAREIAGRLAEAELTDEARFLELVEQPETARELGVEGDTLEGYLFPETYQLARGLTPEEVVGTLVGEFREIWEEVGPKAAARGLGMAETVTLASIVEKETGVPEERPLIAAVFLNRLERGMRLETDPTVIYGIPDFDGNLRRVHLEDADNPYNTYVIPGLPPGPIANPGADALRAVVEPADSDYLFFVSRNDGSHVFSR